MADRGKLHRRRSRWLEDEFRMWAFHTYYAGPFADVKDMTIRFIQALTCSARPARDRQAERRWKAARLRQALYQRRTGQRVSIIPSRYK